MLRSFGIRNIQLSFPSRSDQCRTGPLDVALISTAKKSSSGKQSSKSGKATRRSKQRLVRDTTCILSRIHWLVLVPEAGPTFNNGHYDTLAGETRLAIRRTFFGLPTLGKVFIGVSATCFRRPSPRS